MIPRTVYFPTRTTLSSLFKNRAAVSIFYPSPSNECAVETEAEGRPVAR